MKRVRRKRQATDWKCTALCVNSKNGTVEYTLRSKRGGIIYCTSTQDIETVRNDIEKTLARLNKIFTTKVR